MLSFGTPVEPLRTVLRLTERQIQSMAPPTKRVSLSDGRGLELRVTPELKSTWSFTYRFDGRKTRYTIGPYPAVKLKDARGIADMLRNQIAKGLDPQQRKLQARNPNNILVLECYVQFLERYLKENLKTWAEYDRRMRADFIPAVGQKDITKLQKTELLKIIDRIMDRKAPVLANRMLQYMSRFFKWCVGRGYLEANPAHGIPKPAKERSRDRVLSLNEVKAIYSASNSLGGVIGSFVKILILTGQRRSEISNLRWEELTDNQITISAARSKNGRTIITPLTQGISSVFDCIPRNNGRYIFSTTGGLRPIGNFSRIKSELQRMSDTDNWTFHDFRRAMATHLEDIGTHRYDITCVLDHTDNSVTSVYDRSHHVERKLNGLKAWERILQKSD